jgi:hypothetical protein
MKKTIILYLAIIASFNVLAQDIKQAKITIEVKPVDPKNGYSFELIKTNNEIKISYKRVDSIGKFSFSENDQQTIKRLLGKANVFFDSLSKDSLVYFQHKVDSIRNAHTYYITDSATIYKSSHPDYWKYLETILITPNAILEAKKQETNTSEQTYGFFSLDPKAYPILTRLISDTMDIMNAFRSVKERKH